jgi:uncharacterized membrane protein
MKIAEHPAMVATTDGIASAQSGALARTIDVATSAETAFALLCEVEKWPVWLSFLRSARRLEAAPLALGSEVALRSAIPGEDEQLFEVDRFLPGHMVSLVGAYSIRRRIDFRVESKSQVVRVTARVDYPSYGGALGALFDRMTTRRRLESALGDSLVHFKGLAEFGAANGAPLEDF